MKRFAFWTVLLALPLLVVLASAELFGRIYAADKRPYQYDQTLGWAPKPHFQYRAVHTDALGNEYPVNAATDSHGFRAWGNVDAARPKMLFVGDSFTGDLNMSDTDAYFGYVARTMDAEVFAVGAGGYGTLQELMLIERFAPTIKPDLLIVQFCENDFANNSFELESNSIVRNQKNLRPYLVDGSIVYRVSDNHWYQVLYRNSALFRFLDQRLQNAQFKRYGGYDYPSLPGSATKHAAQRQAEQTTEILLRKMIAATPTAHSHLTFQACGIKNTESTERWTRIATAAGFRTLPRISQAVARAADQGAAVFAADGAHWSNKGHEVAGRALIEWLEVQKR